MSDIEDVFNYWRLRLNHHRSKLDSKRKKAIAERLRDGYTCDDLRQAIDGCAESPWHAQGLNDRHTVFDDISLICRDAEHVDRFIKKAEDAEKNRTRRR